MPSRKRAKPNPPAEASKAPESETPPTSQGNDVVMSDSQEGGLQDNDDSVVDETNVASAGDGRSEAALANPTPDTPRSTRSWYGSWPRTPKASAVAQVAKETIPATTETLVKAAAKTRVLKNTAKSPKPPHRKSSSHLSPGASSRSLPVTAKTTRLNISSDGAEVDKPTGSIKSGRSGLSKEVVKDNDAEAPKSSARSTRSIAISNKDITTDEPKSSSKSTKSMAISTKGDVAEKTEDAEPMEQSTWMGWFGRDGTKKPGKAGQKSEGTGTTSAPGTQTVKPDTDAMDIDETHERGNSGGTSKKSEPTSQRRNSDPIPQHAPEDNMQSEPVARSSWLGMWGGSRAKPALGNRIHGLSDQSTESLPLPATRSTDKKDTKTKTMPVQQTTENKLVSPEISKADTVQNNDSDSGYSSTSWAFWSRAQNTSKAEAPGKAGVGKLAAADSPTQSQPRDAVVGSNGLPRSPSGKPLARRTKPTSVDFKNDEGTESTTISTDSEGNRASAASAVDKPSTHRPTSSQDSQNNLLLPKFKQTYPPAAADTWRLWQQISRIFYGRPPAERHPSLLRDPPVIKNAVAIGVHGYFPAAAIQTIIGRPTGTSVKFANMAASAIRRVTQNHGYSPKNIEKIMLEGEGNIETRLEALWNLLLNYVGKIREADFVIIACHSQGVPVAISLVAKLIAFGCLSGARVGICAMAGINLGPFVDYQSRWIGGVAGELFEFAKPDSRVSKGYEAALDEVLRFGTKITYIGSLDDQLVSLHSSTFGTARHPHIYRAVWVDGRLHVPDFLTHLVGFTLKLRNLGISDHGLIRELSNPLAGSLYGGEGHSRIYGDDAVYDLAIEFALETTTLDTEPLILDRVPVQTAQNPYILPFAMRGLLEEEFVRKELHMETSDLLKQFDDWKPNTKVLRDVKYRLEGIRSKL